MVTSEPSKDRKGHRMVSAKANELLPRDDHITDRLGDEVCVAYRTLDVFDLDIAKIIDGPDRVDASLRDMVAATRVQHTADGGRTFRRPGKVRRIRIERDAKERDRFGGGHRLRLLRPRRSSNYGITPGSGCSTKLLSGVFGLSLPQYSSRLGSHTFLDR